MPFRSILVVLVALVCAQGTVTATTSYTFGTPATNVALATNGYVANVWTEIFTGGAGTTEQIDCVVAALGNITNTCGNPGPGSSAHIGLPAAPTNTAILPGTVTNYLEVDGDPQWGAPVATNLTGLVIGGTYVLSFYQASNEETGNNKAYNDAWQVYLIPSPGVATYICPVCAVPVNPLPGDLVYTSNVMVNTGGVATPWDFESFTFTATATSEVLEFVTDAIAVTSGAFQPPFFDLAGVTLTQVTPEPGTYGLMIFAGAVLFAARKRLRRSANRE